MTLRGQRFQARINTERSIISIVNLSAVGKDFPLAGLSAGAIDDWRRRVAIALPIKIIQRAGEILEEASMRTGLMADNSRIVFDPDFKANPTGLEAIKHELTVILPPEPLRSSEEPVDTLPGSSE